VYQRTVVGRTGPSSLAVVPWGEAYPAWFVSPPCEESVSLLFEGFVSPLAMAAEGDALVRHYHRVLTGQAGSGMGFSKGSSR
jgi:hypothetical protein